MGDFNVRYAYGYLYGTILVHTSLYEIMRGVTSMEVDNCESVGEIKID